MSVWFTSDLHLGHKFVATHRGYPDYFIDDHDDMVLSGIADTLPRRCKLFVLGDIGYSENAIKRLTSMGGKNIHKVLLLGNHDRLKARTYLDWGFNDIIGFRKYKEFWISHAPIRNEDVYRYVGNIHGHLHRGGHTGDTETPPYYNVNVEYHNYKPVSYDRIYEKFRKAGLI